jgi:hypothetical protein
VTEKLLMHGIFPARASDQRREKGTVRHSITGAFPKIFEHVRPVDGEAFAAGGDGLEEPLVLDGVGLAGFNEAAQFGVYEEFELGVALVHHEA